MSSNILLRVSIITTLAISFGVCGNVLAAPSISGVSGTLTHGQSVTISGSGFGTKSIAAPNLWDAVENQYTGLSDGSTIPTGGSHPWEYNSDGLGNIKYATGSSEQRNSRSTACYKASNTQTASFWGHAMSGANYIYMCWYWKTNTSVGGTNHSSKFLRLSDSRDLTNQTFSWTQNHNYVYCNGSGAEDWTEYGGTPNNWDFFEAYMDSVHKTTILKVNNRVVSSINWSGQCSMVFDYVWKVGFDGGGNAPPNITSWMDDIYIDNTLQHVVIGNASTYSSSTHLEVQPPTAWNSNGQSITVKVNQGSYTDGSTAYLYVVDSNNTVNSTGYQITYGQGGGSSSDTTPPATPNGVAVTIIQ